MEGVIVARGINLLSARAVATVTAEGRHSDGGGLYLLVRQRGSAIERLWVFRYKRGGRQASKEITLSIGPLRDVTLANAREVAGRCRTALQRGDDPKLQVAGPITNAMTFGQVADALIEDVCDGFRNAATEANWRRTLDDRYCASLRKKPIAAVTTQDVLAVLTPIWQLKPETARKMRGRIERVIDSAKARGLREGDNPARWRGHLKLLMPRQTARKGHHRALPCVRLPEFMERLRILDSLSALALEWTILTVARTTESIAAPRSEIDREAKVWVVPAERMKQEGREHRVPLTPRCIEIFDELAAFGSPWLFPSRDPRKHMSSMAMTECLRGLGDDATVHGFRSTFRDWAGDHTSFPRELAEAALSHLVGDEAERAYRRSDALERRRKMMIAWERYCFSKATDNVVPLRG